MMLFDFTNAQSVDDWREMSDTVRTVGKSKAVLTLQTSQLFQRAVFFTLLNPQPNGAGFAGVRKSTNLDLSKFQNIEITCRGQGQNSHYKISLRHRGENSNEDLSYEQFFTVKPQNLVSFIFNLLFVFYYRLHLINLRHFYDEILYWKSSFGKCSSQISFRYQCRTTNFPR